jgi:hypothetical protein
MLGGTASGSQEIRAISWRKTRPSSRAQLRDSKDIRIDADIGGGLFGF